MTHLNAYQVNALRTEKPLPTPFARLEHASLGFITETGEIATEVKRMAIYGKPLDAERRAHIAEEIGDVMWYLAIASDACGLNVFHVTYIVPPGGEAKHATFALASLTGDFVDALMLSDEGRVVNECRKLLPSAWGICQALAHLIDIPIDQIAGDNIAKLRARFPDAYSNEAAEARADKGGLDARNS